MSFNEISESLSNGSFNSEDLVQTYLARIAEVNPIIHSVTETNPDALELARELDRERVQNGPRSKLHGIPILVKDTISVHGMNNTAGSYCLVGAKTKSEASIIQRLRDAGVIILGKDNLSQWGNARSSASSSSNGWSAWGGQTYGVYHHHQDPCGSSSGSAVSTTLGLAAAAIGVETVGSITCPAMRSNLVSIKPTKGLVSRDNIIITKLRGSVGPIARSVRDAAILVSVIAGQSPDDPDTKSIPFDTIPNYESMCDPEGLKNSRLAIPRNAITNPFGGNMNKVPVMAKFEEVLTLLRDLGATIIDNANYSAYDEINSPTAPQNFVGPAEYKENIERYLSSLEFNPHDLHSLDDLIACTKSHPEEEYPDRDIEFWEAARVADDRWSDKVIAGSDVAGLTGHPVITVPLGFMPPDTPIRLNARGDLVEEGPGVPFGLSFIGRQFSEQTLIRLAYAFEQSTQFAAEVAPIILPTTEISDITRGKLGFLESIIPWL
ncbi:hypothetical protein N7456_000594 [Penicillium angulare]|uniref:Amidase domain-containing protein n=1 Tax=Penicillium angulare TaxID=116970 RepID=A0A9W9GCG0_9EURO|nr:hypothetical protein N7456_000594 [Penicillium angulare]